MVNRKFPSGWQECKAYLETEGNAVKAKDGKKYVRTPNGNLMDWDKFLRKYAGPLPR